MNGASWWQFWEFSIGTASFLEMAFTAVAVWGLTYAIPNWRQARRHYRDLASEQAEGLTLRLARKEWRLQRNLAVAQSGIVVLGGTLMTQPPGRSGTVSIGGLVLSLMLLYAAPYMAFWSRGERNDGETALLEATELARKTMLHKEMEV